VTAVLAVLAGGALGPGYLAAVGPSGWQVAAALAVEVAVPAAVTAALVPNPERDRAAGSPAPADPAPAAGSGAAAGPADEQDAEERDPRPDGQSAGNRLCRVSARLVVLASGAGSTLGAVLDAVASGQLPAEVVAVGSDRPGCRRWPGRRPPGCPPSPVPLSQFADRADWNLAFARRSPDHRPDLVVCAGFMRVFGPSVVHRFRIVNTHPALLPDFPGAHAIRDALAAAVPTTGVTVHWVDDGVDTDRCSPSNPSTCFPATTRTACASASKRWRSRCTSPPSAGC
jgi:folate-dependent phosphoribosylglycinamide formyltransferase PurN